MNTQQGPGCFGGVRGGLQRCDRGRGAEVQSDDPVGEPERFEMRLFALFPSQCGIGDGFTGRRRAGAFLPGDLVRRGDQRLLEVDTHHAVQQSCQQGMFDALRIGPGHPRNIRFLCGGVDVGGQHREGGPQLRSRSHRQEGYRLANVLPILSG